MVGCRVSPKLFWYLDWCQYEDPCGHVYLPYNTKCVPDYATCSYSIQPKGIQSRLNAELKESSNISFQDFNFFSLV